MIIFVMVSINSGAIAGHLAEEMKNIRYQHLLSILVVLWRVYFRLSDDVVQCMRNDWIAVIEERTKLKKRHGLKQGPTTNRKERKLCMAPSGEWYENSKVSSISCTLYSALLAYRTVAYKSVGPIVLITSTLHHKLIILYSLTDSISRSIFA